MIFIVFIVRFDYRLYHINSNRESGDGRYDIQLMPKNDILPGIIIELKADKNCSESELKKLAATALKQIEDKKYDKLHYHAQIDLINQQLKTYRYEKKCVYNLLERCDIMKEMIDNEMQMRREKREREYKKDVPVAEKPRDERSEEREYYPRYTPPAKPKRKRDDFER